MLKTLPKGVAESLQSVAKFDACLSGGFARLGSEQREELEAFVGEFASSPLGEPVWAALDGVLRSEFLPKVFLEHKHMKTSSTAPPQL